MVFLENVTNHNFEDCVKKSWDNFSINIPNKTKFLECNKLTLSIN